MLIDFDDIAAENAKTIQIGSNSNFIAIKRKLSEQYFNGIDVARLELYFEGKFCNDNETLDSYFEKDEEDKVLHLYVRPERAMDFEVSTETE